MADEVIKEKIYCTECGNNSSAPMWAALMSNQKEDPLATAMLANGGYNNQWNNPMMYLVWMWMMRWMNGNGWDNGFGGAENYNSRAISQLQSTVDNNHNNDLVMQGIQGNATAIHELASNLNVDFNTMSQAICGVKSAIEQVGGQVGMSAERVINATNLGDLNIVQQLKDCCCNTQKAILTQGYEGQLANERQTYTLGSKIDDFKNANQMGMFQMQTALGNQINDTRQALVNGFSNIGYTTAQQTCELKTNQNENTQRIIDVLNGHWNYEQSQELQNAKFEISQMKQNQYLVNALNGCGCNS